jgi:hypothetical protein
MDGDKLLSTQTELENHIHSFYKDLCKQDEQVESNEEAREDCFQFISSK